MSDPTYTQPPADRSLKIPHLVFGLLFLGIAGIWALAASDLISGERLAILGPIVLIAAGVIGLAASLASTRNRRIRDIPPESHPHDYPHTDPGTDLGEPELDDHTKEIR